MAALWLGCAPAAPVGPTISLLEPTDGASVCGDPLVIDAVVAHFTLVAMSGEARAGEGHIDVRLNGQTITMGESPPFHVFGVEDGVWLLTAELVDAEHAAIDPPTRDEVNFEVDNSLCTGDDT